MNLATGLSLALQYTLCMWRGQNNKYTDRPATHAIPISRMCRQTSLLCGRCLAEFIDLRHSQSFWYFRPRFLWTVYLTSFRTYKIARPPKPRRGGGRTPIYTCHKVPLQVIVLDDDILLWYLYSFLVHGPCAWNLHTMSCQRNIKNMLYDMMRLHK